MPAVPVVTGLPGGHQADAVGLGAQRHPSGHAVQYPAVGVGGLDDVDRLGLGDPAGPQQRQQGAEAEVSGDAGRVAQADRQGRGGGVGGVSGISHIGTADRIGGTGSTTRAGCISGPDRIGRTGRADRTGRATRTRRVPPKARHRHIHQIPVDTLGPSDDHRPPVGLDHLDLDGLLARNLDDLRVPGRPAPDPVGPEGLHARAGAPQPLPVQVLVVGHGVGDGPGDRAGVAEVGDAGDAGHGQAHDVELGAGQVNLLVDARVLDPAVRVTGDDRPPGDGPLPAHQPAVAAGGAGAVGGEEADRVRTEVGGDLLAPELGREPGEEDVGGEPDAERGPGVPVARDETGPGELGGRVRSFRQTLVHPVHVRPHPLRRLRFPSLQAVEAASGRVVESGPSGEPVPGQGARAEEGSRGALGPVPLGLHLPGPVAGGDQALRVGEFRRAARAQMRNAPGVAVDLDGHPAPHFPLG